MCLFHLHSEGLKPPTSCFAKGEIPNFASREQLRTYINLYYIRPFDWLNPHLNCLKKTFWFVKTPFVCPSNSEHQMTMLRKEFQAFEGPPKMLEMWLET